MDSPNAPSPTSRDCRRMYHERVETLLAQIRIATAAQKALEAGDLPHTGAVVEFPVVVNGPTVGRRHSHPWSMTVSHEPGTPFPEGVTYVKYQVQIGSCVVAGMFRVCVGGAVTVSSAIATIGAQSGQQLFIGPPSIQIPSVGRARLRDELEARVAQHDRARDELIAFTRPFLVQLARTVRTGMREPGAVDVEDLVQEAWPSVLRLIDQFASPRRPPTTWAAAVRRNVLRDLGRVEPKIVGVSYQVWQIRRWLDRHPDIVEPRDVVRRITIERRLRRTNRSANGSTIRDPKLSDAVSERLVRQAQLIPRIVPLDAALRHGVA
jgi:DNA-directed RNA polymerase specialized sigma24 family protein